MSLPAAQVISFVEATMIHDQQYAGVFEAREDMRVRLRKAWERMARIASGEVTPVGVSSGVFGKPKPVAPPPDVEG